TGPLLLAVAALRASRSSRAFCVAASSPAILPRIGVMGRVATSMAATPAMTLPSAEFTCFSTSATRIRYAARAATVTRVRIRVTTPAAGMVVVFSLEDPVERRAVGSDARADLLDGIPGRDEAAEKIELGDDGDTAGQDGVRLTADLVYWLHEVPEQHQHDRDDDDGQDEIADPPQSHDC